MVMSRVMLSEMLSKMSPKGFYTDFFFLFFFSHDYYFSFSTPLIRKKQVRFV